MTKTCPHCGQKRGRAMGLTKRQRDLLLIIQEWLAEYDVAPSLDEMAVEMDVASKSGIYRILTALERRGRIRRIPKASRAIEILRPTPRPRDQLALEAAVDAARRVA